MSRGTTYLKNRAERDSRVQNLLLEIHRMEGLGRISDADSCRKTLDEAAFTRSKDGRAMYTWQDVSDAAREVSFRAVVHATGELVYVARR